MAMTCREGDRLDVSDPTGIRVGIVGGGFMGRVHAEAARRAGAEVVGAVGSVPERAAATARRVGAARGFSDLAGMLADAALEVVHVCTPNVFHAELARQAVAAGAHVVCEKPLGVAPGEAEGLVAAARAADLVGTVPYVYRFHPIVREMRERVRRGEPGHITVVHGSYLQDWLSRADDDNWRMRAAIGGASRAFADIGSHWCDLLEFVTDDRIASVCAQTARLPRDGHPCSETEDTATVQFKTAAGVLGTVVISQSVAGRKNRLHLAVSGSDASFDFDQEEPDRLWVGGRSASRILVRDPETLSPPAARYANLPAGHTQGYQDCFDAFVADSYVAARGGGVADGLPLFTDGLRSVRLTAAVLASASGGGWTDVTEEGSR